MATGKETRRRRQRLAGRRRLRHAGATQRDRRGTAMKTSQDRILTTPVGRLPRPRALRDILVIKDAGEPYDQDELARLVRQAVVDIVRRQVAVGVDIVNDGEMSKPAYSTYIADRLTG